MKETVELPLFIKGEVEHGKEIGRKIDMPTINMVPTGDALLLEHGVYYSRVYVDKQVYKGITNVGKKPTVKNTDTVNAETFIYDFSGDLYGKEVEVELLEFRRPEIKFKSLDELSKQMHKDLEAGKKYGKER
ncbi:MAG: riboflavin kinase [Lachnospiraceae bacterium]|nr:riboflavin kinase [Lachnospiraceae bacterium]